MHPKTGAIATFETELDAKLAGYTVPLSEADFTEFLGMNRKERRAEIARRRREAKRSSK